MALADYADYVLKTENPSQTFDLTKNSLSVTAGRISSLWATAPFAGAAPTTAAAPTKSTTGALANFNNGSATLYPGVVSLGSGNGGMWILCDRLSHQGGLSGTVTTAQTTNLPTAALTRYTSGVGVLGFLEIYSAVGTTATTFTASYTDQDGNTGQTSLAADIGSATYNAAGRLLPINVAQGDYGLRAVASVTVTSTTGNAGNFGVTLLKPLIAYPQLPMGGGRPYRFDPLLDLYVQFPEIVDDACLQWIFVGDTSSSGILQASLSLFEA